MPGSEDDVVEAVSALVQDLVERLEALGGDDLVARVAASPDAADRLLTGLVLVGQSLTALLGDDDGDGPAPPPRSRRQLIPVRDDDAAAGARRTGTGPTTTGQTRSRT